MAAERKVNKVLSRDVVKSFYVKNSLLKAFKAFKKLVSNSLKVLLEDVRNEHPNEHSNEHLNPGVVVFNRVARCISFVELILNGQKAILAFISNEHPNGTNVHSNEHPNPPNPGVVSLKVELNLALLSMSTVGRSRVCKLPSIKTNESESDVSSNISSSISNEHFNEHSNERSNEHRILCDPESQCSNRFLLMQCGDVEVNPGPRVRGHDDDADAELHEDGGGDEVNDDERYPQNPASNKFPSSKRGDLQVLTLNVRGLSDPKKVRHMVNNCYKMSTNSTNSVFMLQETFVVRLELLKYLWRGEFHLTSGTGNSQGCVTLVTSPFKIVHASDLGNRAHVLVLTKNSIDRAELIVVNAYAPNGFDAAKVDFFEELVEKVSEIMTTYNCEHLVLAGDLNLVFSESELKNRLLSNAEKRVAARVKTMFEQLNLCDGWNEVDNKQFTWSSTRTGEPVFSTLDRILYTKGQLSLLTKSTDWALSLSDHAAVIAVFRIIVQRPNGNSQLSRLDPRLLLDVEGRQHLDSKFRELVDQAPQEWNPHVRLEYYKMSIRTAANFAVGKVKAKLRDTEAILNKDINDVVSELASNGTTQDRKNLLMHKLDDLRQLKRSLVEKIGTKLEQRTARKWYNEGELSNKYFFNLLNRKNNDGISELIDENGAEINDPQAVENKITAFYKDLYESVPANVDDNDHLFRHINQVAAVEADTIVESLTLEELGQTLKTCSDSAPGPDGIPYSYLKHLWSFFGPVLLDAWNYSIRIKELPPSHKVSYLRLIPKVGKDARIVSNLRPITLSNTDHKLLTKTYAKKLTNLVASCIGEEQTAYIPGRLINDNARSMLMTIDLANVDLNVDGAVVSLDAKKAFDSVDHRYIRKCLRAFGMEKFIPIFDILYKDLSSKIIINGRAVDGYSILKGVKQGDALSCIIFIMCMEPLIRNIKSNDRIEPVRSNALNINIPKIYSFADDVTVLTKNCNLGIQAIFQEYESFSGASGLLLNAEKTEILCFNGQRNAIQQFNVDYNGISHRLESSERIKVNGIFLQQDPEQREDYNVVKSVESMDRLLKSWSTRRLTLLGRILIIKTFAISKLIYLMQTMTLNERSYNLFTRAVFKFLWNKNYSAARAPERLKREIMYTPCSMGGFGMMNIKDLSSSLDLRSYGRLLTTNHPFMAQARDLIGCDNFFELTCMAPVDKKLRLSLKLLNEERTKMLHWPSELLLRDLSFRRMLSEHKLGALMTAAGRLSIPFFNIHRRLPRVTLGQLTIREFQGVERYIKYPELRDLIKELINSPINVNNAVGVIRPNELFPSKNRTLVRVHTLSSKQLRLNRLSNDDQLICIYKIGLILEPGEVLSWTNKLKKLTSTRHKNILLRLVHGDIFSNARLARFGLRQDSGCPNCQDPNESIIHKVLNCNSAIAAWEELERLKTRLQLRNLSDLSLENIVGAKDQVNKIELALQAELIHRLTSTNTRYCPKELVKKVVKFIGYSERLSLEQKASFDSLIRTL